MTKYDVEEHQVLGSRQAFDGKVVKVYLEEVRLPDGRKATWEKVEHPGAVGMVPLLNGDTLVMVRQYRHATRRALLEIPAGKLDPGESPEECAQRELAEEVGYRAERMVKLAEFYNSPGYSDEYFHLYMARELVSSEGESEPDEFLSVERVSFEDCMAMISSGRMVDAKSIIGITLTTLVLSGEAKAFGG